MQCGAPGSTDDGRVLADGRRSVHLLALACCREDSDLWRSSLRFIQGHGWRGGRSRTRRDRGRANDRSQERSQIVFHLLSFSRTIFRTRTSRVLFISILNPVMRKTSNLTFGFLSSPPVPRPVIEAAHIAFEQRKFFFAFSASSLSAERSQSYHR